MKGTYFQSSARIKIYGNVNIKPTIQQKGIKAEPSFSDYSHDKPNKNIISLTWIMVHILMLYQH